jgi:hypothetical protein
VAVSDAMISNAQKKTLIDIDIDPGCTIPNCAMDNASTIIQVLMSC